MSHAWNAAGHISSITSLRAAEQIEPATPPASLQRDDAAFETAAAYESTCALEGHPKVISYTSIARNQKIMSC